jgi:hypothetical protein
MAHSRDRVVKSFTSAASGAAAIKRRQANACAGSMCDDDSVHRLVRDASTEMIRFRSNLKEAGIDPTPSDVR